MVYAVSISTSDRSIYINEFEFRYNSRIALEINDAERAQLLLEGINGSSSPTEGLTLAQKKAYRYPVQPDFEFYL